MKKRICLFLLALCLLLPACASATQADTEPIPKPDTSEEQLTETDTENPSASEEQPVEPDTETPSASEDDPMPELSERERNWINDIRFLQERYKTYHPDPFYLCPEEEFDWKIDWLCQNVGSLSDNDIFFELTAIIAGMGDIHTYVLPPDSLYDYLFPFGVNYYNGRLYLTAYMEGYEQLEPYLLREIVAVNGADISYLERKFESIINPNNKWNSREIFCWKYFVPAFFDWADCGSQNNYTFQILDENHKVQSVEVPLVSYEEFNSTPLVLPESWSYREGNLAKYCEGENGGYVYIGIDQLIDLDEADFLEVFEKASELLDEHPDCGKLVIDLRYNPGGLTTLSLGSLHKGIQILKEHSIDQSYVLIGGYTMSAAMNCIGRLKEEMNAVTVGEPTGQFTSFFAYDYIAEIVLPRSQISVKVATVWHDGNDFAGAVYDENGRLYEWEDTILPDVYIHPDIEDARQGKTSALEWILAQ